MRKPSSAAIHKLSSNTSAWAKGPPSHLQQATASPSRSPSSTTPVTNKPTHFRKYSVLSPAVSVKYGVSVPRGIVPSSLSHRSSAASTATAAPPVLTSSAGTSSAALPKRKLDANKLFQAPTTFAPQPTPSTVPPGRSAAIMGEAVVFRLLDVGHSRNLWRDTATVDESSPLRKVQIRMESKQGKNARKKKERKTKEELETTATMSPRTGPMPTLPPPSSSTPVPHPSTSVPQINSSVPPPIPSTSASARPMPSLTPSARKFVPGGMGGPSPMIPSPGFPLPKKSNAINPTTGEAVVFTPPDVGHSRNLSRDTATVHESSPLRKVLIRMESEQEKKARDEKERKAKEELEAKKRKEAEEKAKREEEEREARRKAEEAERLAQEEGGRRKKEVEEKAKREERLRLEEERKRQEEEARKKNQEEERLKKEAEERARKEKEEREREEAEAKARAEAEEKIRKEAEEDAARLAAEAKAYT